MRLLLHIGMGKTGTTSLQQALSSQPRALAEAGVLYPTSTLSKVNHNYIAYLLLPTERLPREFRNVGGSDPASVRKLGAEAWQDIERQIRKSDADTVILSSEYLFYYTDKHVAALHDMLRPIFSDIHIVAYIRNPPSYYLSVVQQKVKASSTIRAPGEYMMRVSLILQRYLRAFDEQVAVRAFERSSLVGGSVVLDFLHNFVPGVEGAGAGPAVDVDVDVNKSMSAEAMCILQDLRRHGWPGQDDVFAKECFQVIALLDSIRVRTPQTQPQLKAEIRAQLTRRHEKELDWLEQRFGVAFERNDGPTTEDAEPDGWMSRDLIDILDVDRADVDRVSFCLMKELSSEVLRLRSAR